MDPSNSDNSLFEDFFLIFDQTHIPQPPALIRPIHPYLDSRELPYKRSSPSGSSGYPLDIFISPPSEDYLCKICSKVVKKPSECKKCGSLFCSSCISNDTLMTPSAKIQCTICNTQTIAKAPSHLLLRIISEQNIKCKNAGLGCNHVVGLGDMQKHEAVCPYKKVLCQNYQNCKNQGYIKDFRESTTHSQGYLRPRFQIGKIYTCSFECFKLVSYKEMVEQKQIVEALKEYFEILKQIEEKI